MTDMQGMLFPPLDDESSKGHHDSVDEVLPQAIKDRFAETRALLRHKNGVQDASAAAELKRKQEAAALETAIAVQEEVSRLQNGIAELEAMYAMQQQMQSEGESDESDEDTDDEDEQEGLPVNNNGIVFPALPSMVYAVEPEPDTGTQNIENNGLERDCEESSESVVATKDILCDA